MLWTGNGTKPWGRSTASWFRCAGEIAGECSYDNYTDYMLTSPCTARFYKGGRGADPLGREGDHCAVNRGLLVFRRGLPGAL